MSRLVVAAREKMECGEHSRTDRLARDSAERIFCFAQGLLDLPYGLRQVDAAHAARERVRDQRVRAPEAARSVQPPPAKACDDSGRAMCCAVRRIESERASRFAFCCGE